LQTALLPNDPAPGIFPTAAMTLDIIETAVKEGMPFVIKMADGEKYEVRERSQIAWRKANVVVMDDLGCPHVLPLLTMTGVSYLPAKNGTSE
jgi:hypothetical protein